MGREVGDTALFDPASESWSPTGHTHFTRTGYTATLLADGQVLLAGGDVESPRSELFEPNSGQFRLAAPLPGKWQRTGAGAVLLEDGRVLLAGGYYSGAVPLDEALLYSPSDDVWVQAEPLPEGRVGLTLTRLADGTVLALGGNVLALYASVFKADAWRYDPRTNHWESAGSLLHPRSRHTTTLLADGRVLVAGGLDESGGLRSTELFDPSTNTFSEGPLLRQPRVDHVAHLLPGGRVLIAGGAQDGNAYLEPSGEELFEPSTGELSAVPRLIQPCAHAASALIGSQVLVTTGQALYRRAGLLSSSELYGCP